MKALFQVVIAMMLVSISYQGCGVSNSTCEVGESKICTCEDAKGTKQCNPDTLTYGKCQCKTQEKVTEPASHEPIADEPTQDASPDVIDQSDATDPTDRQDTIDDTTPKDDNVGCPQGAVLYQDKCITPKEFCTNRFSEKDQASMARPFAIVLDVNGEPSFCQTKAGHYYLEVGGYGICDQDQDGWITIEAYRAKTSTNDLIKNNARCKLLTIEAIVYHQEGADTSNPQLESLSAPVPLVETYRNDGGKKPGEMPLYTKHQIPLPKTAGNACSLDAECQSGELCYFGHCLQGRRFEPAEINTLTKGCIAGLDLNDNQIDDANENPSDTPTPAGEFKPLLRMGYFIELQYGKYQADFDNNGNIISVYHIYERPRRDETNQQKLALRCKEETDAFRPDYWRQCPLRDNQRCPDPNDPKAIPKGLSACWLKQVKRLTPSLFKCVVFDNSPDPATNSGYFHPQNYGFSNNYSRTKCSFKNTINPNDPTKRDIAFDCTQDDGTQQPDASQKEVGWACISFKPYKTKTDYIGGCTDQITDEICGDKDVDYIKHEHHSYGLARAHKDCGQSQGKGECSFAKQICTGGKWLSCNQCNNCPNDTEGSRKACPNGTWPASDCKLTKGPAPEVCDGLDNDCDGQIDEGLKQIPFYKDADGDTYGDVRFVVRKCSAQKPKGYVTNALDCNDTNKNINPSVKEVCDGIDNNCNRQTDETLAKRGLFEDNDQDKRGGKFLYYGCLTPSQKQYCIGPGRCIPTTYTRNGKTIRYALSGGDCCDIDPNTYKGQTRYFTIPNACQKFDYNCDGVQTPKQRLCNCATSSRYTFNAKATCKLGKSLKTWGYVNCVNCTSTHKACELTHTHRFSPRSDYTFSFTCNQAINVCKQSKTVSKSKATVNYSPTAPGGGNFTVFHKSAYTTGCAYLETGARPTCGNTAKTAASSITAPKISGSNTKFDSGSFNCFGCDNPSYSCSFNYSISHSTNYIYTHKSTTTTQIACR